MRILKHIGGSYAVVEFTSQHYIDARKTLSEKVTNLEVVRNGFVYLRAIVSNDDAPSVIVRLMRQYVAGKELSL